MKTKIIPFDLETAKKIQAGEIEGQIKTRDGDKARILCADLRNNKYHIAAAVLHFDYESLFLYRLNGSYTHSNIEHNNDLVLEVPDKEPRFKPFDRVLVRDNEKQVWLPRLFDSHVEQGDFWAQDGKSWKMCIPYEGNEHLVGTTDKPKED